MMTSEIESVENKRLKMNYDDEQIQNIVDLPDSLVVNIGSFLAKPSKALLAVSLTADTSSWVHSESRQTSLKLRTHSAAIFTAVLSQSGWDKLDFNDIDKDFAARLTDDHVHAILHFINAKEDLRELSMAGCVNINGEGLRLLRDSSVKVVDLSLVGPNESPSMVAPGPLLAESKVLPILVTTLDSLEIICLPKFWRGKMLPETSEFLREFNDVLERRNPKCTLCNMACNRERFEEWIFHQPDRDEDNAEYYGMQNFVCSGCSKTFCYSCQHDEPDSTGSRDHIMYCYFCEEEFCRDCSGMQNCLNCDATFCNRCIESNSILFECEDCDGHTCVVCREVCKHCDATSCCSVVAKCLECDEVACFYCMRLVVNRAGWMDCCHGCARVMGMMLEERLQQALEDAESLQHELDLVV